MRPGRVVVKVGGSLAVDRTRLRSLLAQLAEASGELVVVPGGGVFADAVRAAQTHLSFDDGLAHRLALDAMGAMAQIFAALEPRLATADSPAAVEEAWRDTAVPVWVPAGLRAGHPEIPEHWGVTSDSLAVWLATSLAAEACVLVKSVDAPGGSTPEQWAQTGLVDAALPAFARRYPGRLIVHGPGAGDITGWLGRKPLAMAAAGPCCRAAP